MCVFFVFILFFIIYLCFVVVFACPICCSRCSTMQLRMSSAYIYISTCTQNLLEHGWMTQILSNAKNVNASIAFLFNSLSHASLSAWGGGVFFLGACVSNITYKCNSYTHSQSENATGLSKEFVKIGLCQ